MDSIGASGSSMVDITIKGGGGVKGLFFLCTRIVILFLYSCLRGI